MNEIVMFVLNMLGKHTAEIEKKIWLKFSCENNANKNNTHIAIIKSINYTINSQKIH